jgi:soluble lytic murein transglycosylase-like protein
MVHILLGIAKSVGVNPFLLLSICDVETGLRNINNYQDKHGGSYGVAQLKLRTARGIYPHIDLLSLQNPRVNITIAAEYLKKIMRRYKNPKIAAAVYNAGHLEYQDGVLINHGYADKVMKKYHAYQRRMCLLP